MSAEASEWMQAANDLLDRWEEAYKAFTSPYYTVVKQPDALLTLRQCIDELAEVTARHCPSAPQDIVPARANICACCCDQCEEAGQDYDKHCFTENVCFDRADTAAAEYAKHCTEAPRPSCPLCGSQSPNVFIGRCAEYHMDGQPAHLFHWPSTTDESRRFMAKGQTKAEALNSPPQEEPWRGKVSALFKDYVQRPDVQADELTMQVLNCLAGDIEVMR